MKISYSDIFSGCVAGMVGVTVGHPMDTVKVIQHTMNVPTMKAILLTYKYAGIFGFFRGMAFPLFTIGPSNAVFFGVYGTCMNTLQHNKTGERVIYSGNWLFQSFIAGCIGGLVQAIGNSPIEMVKTILQAQLKYAKYEEGEHISQCSNMRTCIRFIIKKGGIRGLYRGFLPLLIRDMPTSGLYMITYEYYTHDVPIIEGSIYLHNMVGGGLAGVAHCSLVTPFDVVKSRMQSDYASNKESLYNGMIDCFSKTYKNEGLDAFFKGWVTVNTRALLVHSVTFLVYSEVMTWFRKKHIFK